MKKTSQIIKKKVVQEKLALPQKKAQVKVELFLKWK